MKIFTRYKNIYKIRAFSIVELLVIISIIAILASISIVYYLGSQGTAYDSAVVSDANSINAAQKAFVLQHNIVGKPWYSGYGADSLVPVSLSTGSVAYVNTNSSGYCIRVYNTSSKTYNSIANAYTIESYTGGCSAIAVSSISVSGGTLFVDSTYYYRLFKTTGAFTIAGGSISADILLVGGGGSGGAGASGSDAGGGGGGGGILNTTQTMPVGTYTITVGQGGTARTSPSSPGVCGASSNMIISGVTYAAYGGCAGGASTTAGTNGASGGGGGSTTTGFGTGCCSQGYNGGSGFASATAALKSGGGGGGSGSGVQGTTGSNATSGQGGAGGNGTSAYTSWGALTGVGKLVNGLYYFGGGGGGGSGTTAGSAGIGGGTAGATSSNASSSADANSGGGTGGTYGGSSGTGGSGVVIIRYPRTAQVTNI